MSEQNGNGDLPITRQIPATELFSHRDAPVNVTRLDVEGEGIFYSIDVWATIGHGSESRYIELVLDEEQFAQVVAARERRPWLGR